MGHILIVDDERSIQVTLKQFLEARGYDTITVGDVDAALQTLVAEPVDVVITDIILPRRNGIELLYEIRRTAPHIPVVIMTGEPNLETAAESVRAGAFDYIAKPVSKTDVLSCIERAVERRRHGEGSIRMAALELRRKEELLQAAAEEDRRRVESEWRHRVLVEQQSDLVVTCTPDMVLTYVSPSYCRAFGKDESELVGTSFSPLIHEDDCEHVAQSLEATRNPPYRSTHEERALTARGWRWFEWSAQAMLGANGGRIHQIISVGRDITDRKRTETELRRANAALAASEKALRALAHNIPAIVYQIRLADQQMVFCNDMVTELTGYTAGELKNGRGCPLESIILPADRDRALQRLEEALANGSSFEFSYRIMTKSNDVRHVEERGSIMRHADGVATQIDGVILDMTEHHRIDSEREALMAQLLQQQKLESIGVLAGGVAHEINNPITGIMNYAQLIKDDADGSDSPLPMYADEILVETRRVAETIRNLLQFARDEVHVPETADVGDILRRTLSLVRTLFRQDGIELVVRIPPDLPPARCCSQQVQQVLMNLLTNARDALRSEEKRTGVLQQVVISAEVRDGISQKRIFVQVMDSGSGVEAGMEEQIFEPLFTTKPGRGGTGMGLSISHRIVAEHGGSLTLQSDSAKGATFQFDLPLASAQPDGS